MQGYLKSDWWALQDLNLGPTDYESAALTAELRALGANLTRQQEGAAKTIGLRNSRMRPWQVRFFRKIPCANSAFGWHNPLGRTCLLGKASESVSIG